MTRRRCRAGFTLIEMMIVVSVIAILAAMAYPSYQEYVLKGRRAEGRTALANLMLQQERYLTQNGAYAAFSYGDTTAPGSLFKQFSGDSDNAASYHLSADACDGGTSLADCVQLIASPQFSDPKANNLKINSLGQRSCDGTSQNVCWN